MERLCYVGTRGMGALEFQPATLGPPTSNRAVKVERLVDLSNRILAERARLGGVFSGNDDQEAINDILRVGTSAGGARAKAILAWNPKTNEFRSGQIDAGTGFEHWLLKFDGITSSHDTEVATPTGYGKIEYAYHLMAVEAGIEMTKRFDRSVNGKRDGFMREDLLALAKTADIKKVRSEQMVDRVIEAVSRWPDFAAEAGVSDIRAKEIQNRQRTNL